MSKEQTGDLLKFLNPFPAEIQKTALWLGEFVTIIIGNLFAEDFL